MVDNWWRRSGGRHPRGVWRGLLWLALAAGAAAGAFPPPDWHWSNPQPHGNDVVAMAAADGLYAQVGDHGRVYASDDLQTWIPYASQTTNALRSAVFFGGRLVITGEKGTVLFGDALNRIQPGTLLDGATEDWLEGLAASPDLLVAVGDRGAIYTSTDGAAWRRQPVSVTNWWRGVAWGGGGFIAVGEQGMIASSATGAHWQIQPSGTRADLNGVSWVNGEFVVVGNGGVAIASADGQRWQPLVSGATNDLYAVAASDTALLLAGEEELRLRTKPQLWSNQLDAQAPGRAPSWPYYCALWATNADGIGSLLAAGRTGMTAQGTPTNGTVAWAPIRDSVRNWLWDVQRTPTYNYLQGDNLLWQTNYYLAVGDFATVMTSGDGVHWEVQPVPSSITNTVFLGVAAGSLGWLAAGGQGALVFSPNRYDAVVITNVLVIDGVTHPVLQTNLLSTLGEYWVSVNSGTPNDLQGIAVRDGLYVVTGGGGTILTSTNGTNWSRETSPTTAFLSSVESHPGGWIAAGDRGTLLASRDAKAWLSLDSPTTNWIYRARWLNGIHVAVGENGLLMTSSDGARWVPQPTGISNWLTDVAWVDSKYYAVGTQGTVLSSADAKTWTPEPRITSKSLYSATAYEGQLIAVGVEGVILRRQLTPLRSPLFYQYTYQPPIPSGPGSYFIFAGAPDQRFTLDHSTNLVDWVTGPLLEIFGETGTTVFDEDTVIPSSLQFYRPTFPP